MERREREVKKRQLLLWLFCSFLRVGACPDNFFRTQTCAHDKVVVIGNQWLLKKWHCILGLELSLNDPSPLMVLSVECGPS
jgi:hypothetical protein